MMRALVLAAISCLLVACADSHQLIRNDSLAAVRLSVDDSILIAVPEDGVYGTSNYRGSGQNAAQIIYSAFAERTSRARVSRAIQSFDEALATCRQSGQKYLVYPTILHWEDRATEWSGIPDKVEVKIEIVDSASGQAVTSAIVKGKSGLATFGGDHPQDLLSEPVAQFVSSLY